MTNIMSKDLSDLVDPNPAYCFLSADLMLREEPAREEPDEDEEDEDEDEETEDDGNYDGYSE